MSRLVKIAVSKPTAKYIIEHYEQYLKKNSEVKLFFKIIPRKNEISEDEFRNLISDAEIIIIHPSLALMLSENVTKTTKWVQSLWVGMDPFDKLPETAKIRLKDTCVITRVGGAHSERMAEYVIGAVISMERNFHAIHRNQAKGEWIRTKDFLNFRPLSSVTIGILGLGEIGTHIAEVCKSLGMTAYGLKRSLSKNEHVEKVFLSDELPQLLEISDYICNVLPSTPATRGLLSGEVLKVCSKRKPKLINIGRGDIIDEKSLINALQQEWMSGAFLDVFEKEPLDKDSVLWSMKGVIITPHVASACDDSAVKPFFNNLMKYLNNQKLDYVHNLDKKE